MSRTVLPFLMEHAGKQPISFHMPGHKGHQFYKKLGYGDFLAHLTDYDITEIPGADNLFQTEGVLQETQKRYAALFEVEKSYLLVNGSSGGIIAAILASVGRGGKLIMARNCHKSVFNALTLGDIAPVYLHPEVNAEYGILGGISPEEVERCILQNPEAEAIILPSPNYYGICSDVARIAEIAHAHGKVLIVDQAHGAHMKWLGEFMDGPYPPCAEDCGADLVINSIHKTLASFTQSAVLNYNSEIVSSYDMEDQLQAIQSTSPSYILMASLDMSREILQTHGHTLMKEWAKNLKWLYGQIEEISNIQAIAQLDLFDVSKINVDTSKLGITANQLEDFLLERNIFPELTTGNILMFMSGIGNCKGDYQKLAEALREAAAFFGGESAGLQARDGEVPPMPQTPVFTNLPQGKCLVPLKEAVGAVSAGMIIPYPPGIPILCPGERIGQDMVDYVIHLRGMGEKVIGVEGDGRIFVGK